MNGVAIYRQKALHFMRFGIIMKSMKQSAEVSAMPSNLDAEMIVGMIEASGLATATAPKRESLAWRIAFVSHYPCLSAAEVADESGNTAKNRSALASRWAAEGKIFSIRFQSQTLYPGFQFRHGEPIPAIAGILKEIAAPFTGWDVAFFLTSPNAYLDGKQPLELLRTDPERVVSLAHAFAHAADAF